MSTNWRIFKDKMLEGCKNFIPTFFPKDKKLTPLGGLNHCPKLFTWKEFLIYDKCRKSKAYKDYFIY